MSLKTLKAWWRLKNLEAFCEVEGIGSFHYVYEVRALMTLNRWWYTVLYGMVWYESLSAMILNGQNGNIGQNAKDIQNIEAFQNMNHPLHGEMFLTQTRHGKVFLNQTRHGEMFLTWCFWRCLWIKPLMGMFFLIKPVMGGMFLNQTLHFWIKPFMGEMFC